jgi:hypothetical protein
MEKQALSKGESRNFAIESPFLSRDFPGFTIFFDLTQQKDNFYASKLCDL